MSDNERTGGITDVPDWQRCLSVLSEGYAERLYQADKWADGSVGKLDENDDRRISLPEQWVAYTVPYLGSWVAGKFPPYSRATLLAYRKNMLKVMMLAVGAILWTDRRLAVMFGPGVVEDIPVRSDHDRNAPESEAAQ